MDYCLGDPDGSATMWSVDGGPRVEGVDVDGDGLTDDVLSDLDGDGIADLATLDLDDDGVAEAHVSDDGTGTWTVGPGRGAAVRWFGLDGAEHPASDPVDVDGDPATAERLVDADGDVKST